MHGYTRIPSVLVWRRLCFACAICTCLVVILLYGMITDVALGQSHTSDRVTTTPPNSWSPSLALTTPVLNQLYLPLINTKPVPKQQIAQIDDVTVMVLGDKPPRLRITAYGMADADGWRNPELVLRAASTTSLAEVPTFDFMAEPPTEIGLPVLRPVSATYELTGLPLVAGVRIYALNNAKESPLHGIGQANLLLAPHQPHSDDPLQVIVHGIWRDGCVPSYQSHQLSNRVITIMATSPTLADPVAVCGQALTPWNFSVAVGPLSADVYTVTVGGAVTATTTFTVADTAALQ